MFPLSIYNILEITASRGKGEMYIVSKVVLFVMNVF